MMHLQGLNYITNLASQPHYSAKMVFNANGAIFFPVATQHRDQSGPGIRYADDYKGNALAAMLSPGKIEVRYHRDYSDQQVAEIIASILADPRLAALHSSRVTYQGRELSLSS